VGINSFRDLQTWQAAHRLVTRVYKITDTFPNKDAFGLTSQMQRCSLSVSSNIAEGFGRHSINDKLHFYVMARGSLTELQNQLIVAYDVGRLTKSQFDVLSDLAITTHKLLHGLMRSTRNYKNTS
jgi:four helix bundle protein